MSVNFKKLFAMKKRTNEILDKYLPKLENRSGIYIFSRIDENDIKYAYIGQALHLKDRIVSHLMGYSQRIDISLKKRKIADKGNPYGWNIKYCFYPPDELDEQEKETIMRYANVGYQLYNKTLGGQGVGKVGINDGQSTKGYRDGVAYGRKQAIKEVKEFFDKYLDYDIKEPRLTKNGKPVAIKEKKLNEFKLFLEE